MTFARPVCQYMCSNNGRNFVVCACIGIKFWNFILIILMLIKVKLIVSLSYFVVSYVNIIRYFGTPLV